MNKFMSLGMKMKHETHVTCHFFQLTTLATTSIYKDRPTTATLYWRELFLNSRSTLSLVSVTRILRKLAKVWPTTTGCFQVLYLLLGYTRLDPRSTCVVCNFVTWSLMTLLAMYCSSKKIFHVKIRWSTMCLINISKLILYHVHADKTYNVC